MAVERSHDDQPVADGQGLPDEVPALIGTLQTRRNSIRIYAGLRYSVQDANGKALAVLITDDELWDQFPGLFYDLKHALAVRPLWAGL